MKTLMLVLPFTLLLALTLAGCGPAGERKVSARSQSDYDNWFTDTTPKLLPDDVRVLQTAQNEIKLEIMAHGNASGSAAVDDAFLRKVDGMTSHDMMVLGLQDRLARLKVEHDEAQKLYDANSKIKTRAGDDASASYVSTRVAEDRLRADNAAAAIAATQADLTRLNK